MKAKKAKEQLIASTILSSVFVVFIYLKMNPEINVSSENYNKVNEIVNKQIKQIEIDNINLESQMENTFVQENGETIELFDESGEEQSLISFTENELRRAKAYIDRDWKPDHTINITAWEYVTKNPNINNRNKDNQINKESHLEINEVVNALK